VNFNDPIRFPDFQHPRDRKEPPEFVPGMIWEQKLDGVRVMASFMALKLRNIHLAKHKLVLPDGRPIPRGCLLDGEVVAKDENFTAVQGRLTRGQWTRLEFIPFDILYWDGKSLRSKPYQERWNRLITSIGFSPKRLELLDEGLEQVPLHWEGVVGKMLDDPYQAGRHGSWVKWKQQGLVKCMLLGFAEGEGTWAGTVGKVSFGIRLNGKDIELGHAGGLTFKDRWEFQHRPEKYIGRLIWIKHYGMIKTRFRNASFEGFVDEGS
jgi:bifunctional non-homologous end joining protein LigD